MMLMIPHNVQLQSGEKPRWFGDKAFRKFKQKIQLDDRNADFSWRDRLVVRCSRCLKTVTMRAENDTERWREHRRSGRCRNAKGGQSFITQFFRNQPPAKTTSSTKVVSTSCPGLSYAQDPRIPRYLARTPVPSGGAPRREVLRLQVLHEYARTRNRNKLSPKQIQSRVLAQERSQARWLNYHANGVVTSAKCQKKGKLSPSGEVLPCSDCNKILRLKIFKNALRKPAPAPRNAKFTPWSYWNPVAGEAYLRHEDVQELMEMVSP